MNTFLLIHSVCIIIICAVLYRVRGRVNRLEGLYPRAYEARNATVIKPEHIGQRVLAQHVEHRRSFTEFAILGVSPSGQLVKYVRLNTGMSDQVSWGSIDAYEVVEVVGPYHGACK